MIRHKAIIIVVALFTICGCAGLNQFPIPVENPAAELKKRDPEYFATVNAIEKATAPEAKKLRNGEITRRLKVVDDNFEDFRAKLAKENVKADFGVSIVAVGAGAAGSLVSETASQILSAVSGGLAGAQAAYTKAALFDKALPSLLAQMEASRQAVSVKIFEGMTKSIDEYSLAEASHDIDSYYLAGSLPGAVIATSADAKVKKDEAEDQLAKFRENAFFESKSADRLRAYVRPPDGAPATPINVSNKNALRNWIDTDSDATAIVDLPIANFFSNKGLEKLRQQAIKDLDVP